MDFADPADHRVKLNESKNKDKYIEKKTGEQESGGDTICNWCTWYSHQRIATGTGGLGNQIDSADHSNFSIFEII